MKKTSIPWTDYTVNPIKGQCKHMCPYCYTKRVFDKFNLDRTPALNINAMKQIRSIKEPSLIFVCSMHDIMGKWVPDEWINQILKSIHSYPQHIFQLLTKNPSRYVDFEYPENVWCGTSVTTQDDLHRLDAIRKVQCTVRFISFEPILDYMIPDLTAINWAILGAETVRNSFTPRDVQSAQKWAIPLQKRVREEGVPMFIKPNLQWKEKIEEYPTEYYRWKK